MNKKECQVKMTINKCNSLNLGSKVNHLVEWAIVYIFFFMIRNIKLKIE